MANELLVVKTIYINIKYMYIYVCVLKKSTRVFSSMSGKELR